MQEAGMPATAAPTVAPATGFWTAVWALVRKDLRLEQHTRQILSVMIIPILA